MKKKFVKLDHDKIDFTMLDFEFLKGVSEVLMFGEKKYTRGNWMNADLEDGIFRYKKAAIRHLLAYALDGELMDPETNMYHLDHLACCVMFARYFEEKKRKVISKPIKMEASDEAKG